MKFKALFSTPTNIVATVFGIGYLPSWNRAWPQFLAFCIMVFTIIIYREFTDRVIEARFVCNIALFYCFYSFLLSLLFGKAFLEYYNDDSALVIDALFSQFLVISLTIPAVYIIEETFIVYLHSFCKSFLLCPNFLYEIFRFGLLIVVPFSVTRFFDVMEFWPTSYFNIMFRESIVMKHVSVSISAIYSICSTYLFAFLVCKLSPVHIVNFYIVIYWDILQYFTDLFYSILVLIEKVNFMGLFI